MKPREGKQERDRKIDGREMKYYQNNIFNIVLTQLILLYMNHDGV